MAATSKKTRPSRLQEALMMARETGLLRGARTEIVSGRLPKALVRKAKAASRARSDTELIEVALANLAVADQCPDWLLSQRGTIGKEIDLEFWRGCSRHSAPRRTPVFRGSSAAMKAIADTGFLVALVHGFEIR